MPDCGDRRHARQRDLTWPGRSGQGIGAITAIAERLPVLSPDQDEAILRDAGFMDVELFYAAFTFRGWVCRKG